MKLLVTGGAGYIGSVVAAQLIENGHEVVILDDLSTGHAEGVPRRAASSRATCARGGAGAGRRHRRRAALRGPVAGRRVGRPTRAVLGNNLGGTLALLEAMRGAGVAEIVFSSTAAVYGEPETVPSRAAPTSHQPVRRRPSWRGHHAGRVRPDARVRRGQPALFQRRRRLPGAGRRVARRAARPGDASDPEHPVRRAAGADEAAMFGDD